MKIQQLLETEIAPTALPSNTDWYHSGPNFDQFSTAFLGQGENNHLLGYGIYFINSVHIAKNYGKYAKDGKPVLYKAKLNATSDDFYCNRNRPGAAQAEGLNTIAKVLGYETYQDIPYKHSTMKYGRGIPGAVFATLGAQKGIALLVENGILGQYEDVGDGIFEIAVYDTSIIQIVEKENLPTFEIPEPDPDLDAWWEEMMKSEKPS